MAEVNKVLNNRALTMELIRDVTAYRIRGLPQVLQDLIAEYNVDHRPQMYPVHRQIMQTMFHAPLMKHVFQEIAQTVDRYDANICDNCMNYVDNYEYTYHIFNDTLVYCSSWCMNESIHDIRKQMKRDMRNQKLSV